MKKTEKQFVPVDDVLAGRHELDDAKLETLNRARLDALGAMLQASKACDAAEETMFAADKLFLKRERAWRKADRAFWDYLESEAAK